VQTLVQGPVLILCFGSTSELIHSIGPVVTNAPTQLQRLLNLSRLTLCHVDPKGVAWLADRLGHMSALTALSLAASPGRGVGSCEPELWDALLHSKLSSGGLAALSQLQELQLKNADLQERREAMSLAERMPSLSRLVFDGCTFDNGLLPDLRIGKVQHLGLVWCTVVDVECEFSSYKRKFVADCFGELACYLLEQAQMGWLEVLDLVSVKPQCQVCTRHR
jgi:hypothetical protein